MWLPLSSLLASPLVKIPILMTATKLVALSMTPPTPPATDEEKEHYQGQIDPMKPLLRRSGVYKVRRVSQVIIYPSHG